MSVISVKNRTGPFLQGMVGNRIGDMLGDFQRTNEGADGKNILDGSK
jgi:nucleoid-associated protein YejK